MCGDESEMWLVIERGQTAIKPTTDYDFFCCIRFLLRTRWEWLFEIMLGKVLSGIYFGSLFLVMRRIYDITWSSFCIGCRPSIQSSVSWYTAEKVTIRHIANNYKYELVNFEEIVICYWGLSQLF